MLFGSGEQLTVVSKMGVCVWGGGSLKGRKEKKTERWVWGARTAPAPWSLGLLAEHMNPLTCKLLVAVN